MVLAVVRRLTQINKLWKIFAGKLHSLTKGCRILTVFGILRVKKLVIKHSCTPKHAVWGRNDKIGFTIMDPISDKSFRFNQHAQAWTEYITQRAIHSFIFLASTVATAICTSIFSQNSAAKWPLLHLQKLTSSLLLESMSIKDCTSLCNHSCHSFFQESFAAGGVEGVWAHCVEGFEGYLCKFRFNRKLLYLRCEYQLQHWWVYRCTEQCCHSCKEYQWGSR